MPQSLRMIKKEVVLLSIAFLLAVRYGIGSQYGYAISSTMKMNQSISKQWQLYQSNLGKINIPIKLTDKLKSVDIAIAGLVKDAESTLPHLIEQISAFQCAFRSVHIFVLESNSIDQTRQIVKKWQNDINNGVINCDGFEYYDGNEDDNEYEWMQVKRAMESGPIGLYNDLREQNKNGNFRYLRNVNQNERDSVYYSSKNGLSQINNELVDAVDAKASLGWRVVCQLVSWLTAIPVAELLSGQLPMQSHLYSILDSKSLRNRDNSDKLRVRMENGNGLSDGQSYPFGQSSRVRVRERRRLRARAATSLRMSAILPNKEFKLIEKEGKNQNREERYAVYRNELLAKIGAEMDSFDHLIWLDYDLRGFDASAAHRELSLGWQLGYDLVCANGVKYNGWYYDSYATVLPSLFSSLYSAPPIALSNRLALWRFAHARSCFGGFASYRSSALISANCSYYHSTAIAYSQIASFARFVDSHPLSTSFCEHIPFNFCLIEHGARAAIATNMHSYYGTSDSHG